MAGAAFQTCTSRRPLGLGESIRDTRMEPPLDPFVSGQRDAPLPGNIGVHVLGSRPPKRVKSRPRLRPPRLPLGAPPRPTLHAQP